MSGKVHYQLGILYYLLLCFIPIFAAGSFFHTQFSLLGIGAAALGALLPDLDAKNSKIHRINPVLRTTNGLLDKAERALALVLKILFTIGLGFVMCIYAPVIIVNLEKFGLQGEHAAIITYGMGGFLILLGFVQENIVMKLPGFNKLYQLLRSITQVLKRGASILVYAGLGIWIIYYNYQNGQEFLGYVWGVLFILVSVFPHRTFLHSPEGLLIFTAAVVYLADKLQYPILAKGFYIGYFSHLYLADIFTKEGVPISSIPAVLKKTGVHGILSKYKIYRRLYKLFNIHLVIPIATGKRQQKVEQQYVLGLFVLTVAAGLLYLH